MFSPDTLMLITSLVAAGGKVMAGVGGMQAADYNARIARQQADMQRQAAEDDAARVRRAGRQTLATQRARAAASGVDVNAGSAFDLALDTLTQSSLDATTARLRREYQAWGLEAEARQQEFVGQRTLLTGFMEGAGALASGYEKLIRVKGRRDADAWDAAMPGGYR